MDEQKPRNAAREAVRLYSVPDAAEHLGVSDSYVYKRIAAGDIRVVELGDAGRSKRRIRQDDLDSFIESRTHP
ncbi:MAG: helix-turn-helix domain-containing protein [Pseudoclavibacter sp.]